MKFIYYLLLSILIHISSVFIVNLSNNKDKLLGEKLAPIEILVNKSFKVQGGNFKDNSKKLRKNIRPEKNIDKEIKKKIEKKIEKKIKKKIEKKIDKEIQEKSNNKNLEKKDNDFKKVKEGNLKINELKKKKEKSKVIDKKIISDPLTSENKKKGISTGENKVENEKGSIKGKGKLKITCLRCISPNYPERALRKGLEGKPLIKVWILTNGSVEKASILRSSGISSIDNAALKAALESVFYPIKYNVTFKIEYDLKLK